MTIKIKAPRAWGAPNQTVAGVQKMYEDIPVRIVHESDWRKLMKLVRECEASEKSGGTSWGVWSALDALRGKK